MRDKKLDYYRGLIMIYIVGIIHILYWSGLVSFKYKSLFLVEMIYIFFIMGVSYSFSPLKNYKEYFIKRIQRCIVPFLVYNLIVLVLNFYFKDYKIDFKTIKDLIDPRMEYNKLPFLNWHIWFLSIYLLIIPIIPILYTIYKKANNFIVPIIFISVIFLFDYTKIKFQGEYYIRNLLFYSFFIYLGFFYRSYNFKKNIKNHILLIIICLINLFYLRNMYSLDMQLNKFPPNFYFFIYTFLIFNISLFFKDIFIKIIEKIKIIEFITRFYAKYNYTLYLFHPFVYVLLFKFIGLEKLRENKLNILLMIILVIFLNMINGKVFYKLEKLDIIKEMRRIDEKLYKIIKN